ncbi:unnamed protein product [Cuscuta epithymum]|uniref:DNA-directed RNA polymerase III subunit RPC3 n=1 Tax=Cuscuta epithymum TaxID=186058 RepID=A0AAV0CSE1_9ASTE|nr:unnamed protein product [Cuscuta epithymum]
MASQHGIKLAVHLVSSLLGDHNAKVCECLLRRGTLTLPQIIQFTELSADNVRKCLLVLIHHNCVQAFAIKQDGAFGTEPKIVTNYMALFDNIIHRMRFPKFLEIVSQELDKKCGEMFEGLLQHGRLSFSQILDRHKETAKQEVSGEDDVLDRFQRLAQARFVERCPDPLPFLDPHSKDKDESAAKKKAKKASKLAEKSIETQALEEAAPMESLRFSVEMDSWNDVPGCSKNTKEGKSVAAGGKRKKDESELSVKDEKKVLWRVNCEEFVRRLRHKACVANVKARINDEAAIVLDAILELSRSSGTQVKADNSASLSINSIYDAVITKEAGLGMDLERIRGSLVQLGCEVPLIPIDESYSIDLKNIIEVARTEEVEPIVLKRYGREAFRMFRLVSKTGRLMLTEEISDATFVEKKDALRILLGLWQDDYLEMKKIIVRGNNQTEQMLWSVSKQLLWKRVLDEMYHAALNLRLRITHEQEQVKKLVGELGRGDGRSANVRLLLESAFMNLDDAIMLFHDF